MAPLVQHLKIPHWKVFFPIFILVWGSSSFQTCFGLEHASGLEQASGNDLTLQKEEQKDSDSDSDSDSSESNSSKSNPIEGLKDHQVLDQLNKLDLENPEDKKKYMEILEAMSRSTDAKIKELWTDIMNAIESEHGQIPSKATPYHFNRSNRTGTTSSSNSSGTRSNPDPKYQAGENPELNQNSNSTPSRGSTPPNSPPSTLPNSTGVTTAPSPAPIRFSISSNSDTFQKPQPTNEEKINNSNQATVNASPSGRSPQISPKHIENNRETLTKPPTQISSRSASSKTSSSLELTNRSSGVSTAPSKNIVQTESVGTASTPEEPTPSIFSPSSAPTSLEATNPKRSAEPSPKGGEKTPSVQGSPVQGPIESNNFLESNLAIQSSISKSTQNPPLPEAKATVQNLPELITNPQTQDFAFSQEPNSAPPPQITKNVPDFRSLQPFDPLSTLSDSLEQNPSLGNPDSKTYAAWSKPASRTLASTEKPTPLTPEVLLGSPLETGNLGKGLMSSSKSQAPLGDAGKMYEEMTKGVKPIPSKPIVKKAAPLKSQTPSPTKSDSPKATNGFSRALQAITHFLLGSL